jgi:hypothetical protein
MNPWVNSPILESKLHVLMPSKDQNCANLVHNVTQSEVDNAVKQANLFTLLKAVAKFKQGRKSSTASRNSIGSSISVCSDRSHGDKKCKDGSVEKDQIQINSNLNREEVINKTLDSTGLAQDTEQDRKLCESPILFLIDTPPHN